MKKQLGMGELMEIVEIIAHQYLKFARYSMLEEVENLVDSAKEGCDEFLRTCHIVFGSRYDTIFLCAQHECYNSLLWNCENHKNRDDMSESQIIIELETYSTLENTSALCVHALEQNHYTPMEPIIQKSHTISECANRLYQYLDPHNILRNYLD